MVFLFVLGLALAQTSGSLTAEQENCLVASFGRERFDAFRSGTAYPTDEEKSKAEVCFPREEGTESIVSQPTPPRLDPALENCMKSVVGEERFVAMMEGRAQPSSEEQSKLSVCFQGTAPTAQRGSTTTTVSLDPELERCVIDAMGRERYEAIKAGSPPTPEEQQSGGVCFQRAGKIPTVVHDPNQGLDDKMKQCLILAIGGDRFNSISRGESQPTLEERGKGMRCFGGTPSPVAPPPNVTISQGLEACLRETVGNLRFEVISSGKDVPTSEEQAKGEACFKGEKERKVTATTFTPLPPEEVPYLTEDKDAVKVGVEVEGEDMHLGGTAAPNTVVDVYVYSDPSVFSFNTDEKGQWEGTVKTPEGEDDHSVIAVAREKTGSVRSALTRFFVAKAAEAQTPEGAKSGAFLLLVSIAAILAAVLLLFLFRHHRRYPETK